MKKESQGGMNIHLHVHAVTLSMTAAIVSDSPMMTHSGLRFHVLEPTGTPTHTDEEIMRSRPTRFSLVCPFKAVAEKPGQLANIH